jgi:hypothetical protein
VESGKIDSIAVNVQANDFDSIFTKVNTIDTGMTALTSAVNTVDMITNGISADVNTLLSLLGTSSTGGSTDTTLLTKVNALQTAIGAATDTAASGTLFGRIAAGGSATAQTDTVLEKLKGLKDDVAAAQKIITGYVDDVESAVGSSSDTANEDTIFGKLAGMESVLAAAGSDATNAALYARDAKSQALVIAGTIADIRTSLNEGNMDTAVAKLNALAETMAELQAVMGKIPEGIATEGLLQSVKEALDDLDGLAKEKGYEGLVPAAAEELKPVDPSDISEIRDSVSGLKSLMTEVRNLLDKEVNKPVVHGWLEETE